MRFSAQQRAETLEALRSNRFDVVVIGGGITGAGIALDASKRGMKVALIEMQDFSAGTSSRSTKLIHGGLRYLKQLQISVVKSSGRERAVVYHNGPHVTTPEWMLLPFHKGGSFGPLMTSIGLRVYDYLAGVKPSERRKMLSRGETIQKVPLIKQEGLLGAGYYVEYRTDDARLTIEVMKKALEFGATLINYVKVDGFFYTEDRQVSGVSIEDLVGGERFSVVAERVVNATGPWVDELRKKDQSPQNRKHLRLTKGIHLVFDQKDFPLKQAVYFDTKRDQRMVFAIPRAGKTYVGTTDTVYEGDKINPVATSDDRDYILAAINEMFPSLGLIEQQIVSSWAGIRPLIWEEGKNPSEISRKDEIWESESGLLTIAGGKLTGYRHMSEEIVDRLTQLLKERGGKPFAGCSTKQQPISGGEFDSVAHFEHFVAQQGVAAISLGLTAEEGSFLARHYGTNSAVIFAHLAEYHQAYDTAILAEKGLSKLTALRLWYALEYEAVVYPDDFLIRRTGALFFDMELVNREKEGVVAEMRRYFGWDYVYYQKMIARVDHAIYDALTFSS